jgi:hypothetical protein
MSMEWQTEQMRTLIDRLGDTFYWYKPRDCSCITTLTPGFETRNCTNCHGTGIIWVAQTSTGLKALVQSQVPYQQRNLQGWVYSDQIIVTFMPDDVDLAIGDKLVLIDKPMQTHERLTRGATTEDELQYTPAYAIGVAAPDTTVYIPTTDYALNTGKTAIKWVAGHGPTTGQVYSVRYFFLPSYIAYQDLPHMRAEGLPRSMKLNFGTKGVDTFGSGTP